jgi:hypothetical protein
VLELVVLKMKTHTYTHPRRDSSLILGHKWAMNRADPPAHQVQSAAELSGSLTAAVFTITTTLLLQPSLHPNTKQSSQLFIVEVPESSFYWL